MGHKLLHIYPSSISSKIKQYFNMSYRKLGSLPEKISLPADPFLKIFMA